MKKKSPLFYILGVSALILGVFIASELVYQVTHNPRQFANLYFKNIPTAEGEGILANYYNSLIAKSLYFYLSGLDSKYTFPKNCHPFCLEYEEEQTLLKLFKEPNSKNAFVSLKDDEEAEIYFWMAEINVFHSDDSTTLSWLEKGLSLNFNEKYKVFYDDLRDLSLISLEPDKKKYFVDKLESVEGDEGSLPRYQRIYLAKASYNLASDFLTSGGIWKAREYAQKAITFNPWGIDYYLLLSEIDIGEGESKLAEETLNRCILKIPKDSQACKEKLTSLTR